MLKKSISTILVATGIASLGGCASMNFSEMKNGFTTSKIDSIHHYKPTNPDKVKLFYKDNPNAESCSKYNVLGHVKVDSYDSFVGFDRSETSMNKYLKSGTASLGGNELINIHEVDQKQVGLAVRCLSGK